MKPINALKWGVVGALPGLLLLFLAYFVIEGEWQLTVGAPGFILAPLGFLGGAVYGWMR